MATTDTHVCASCDTPGLERTRFFQRQLVTPDDLTQDQVYFREKLRRHNRLLHGWGVVCGARCKWERGSCELIIEPGYILGPYGDEIVIDREITIDVCKQDLDGNVAGPCGEPTDPWCSDVRVDRRAGDTLYIAVRYAECQNRPVRVMTAGCGCEPELCEYSRIRDSHVIRVLTKLPATYDPMPQTDLQSVWKCRDRGRPCPPCPTEPWVILADVKLGDDGKIDKVDCFAHRRYVASFADFYFICTIEAQPPKVSAVRIFGELTDQQPAVLDNPLEKLSVQSGLRAKIIEVSFVHAEVDMNSVVDGMTFQVKRVEDGFPLAGTVEPEPEANTVRWIGNEVFSSGAQYQVILVGDGEEIIKSKQGIPLDGDPKDQFPSGNDRPGGDFSFTFQIPV